jgi:hypothetical protein
MGAVLKAKAFPGNWKKLENKGFFQASPGRRPAGFIEKALKSKGFS